MIINVIMQNSMLHIKLQYFFQIRCPNYRKVMLD